MPNRFKIALLLHLLCSFCLAQEHNQLSTDSTKWTYRKSASDKIIAKIGVFNELEVIDFDNEFTQDTYNITPNSRDKIKLSVDYEALGFSFAFDAPRVIEKDLVDTKSLDLGFNFYYSDQWRQELIFNHVKGFYDQNIESDDGRFFTYPNLKLRTYGGKTFYVSKQNYSYRAFDNQTEYQLKTANTWMPAFTYFYRSIKNPDVSSAQHFIFSELRTFNFFFQMGYMHNFVFLKNFLLTVGLHPGIGYSFSTTNYLNVKRTKENSFVLPIDMNLGINYQNQHWLAGIRLNYKSFTYINEVETNFINSRHLFDIYIGYQFKAPKKLQRFYKRLEGKLLKFAE